MLRSRSSACSQCPSCKVLTSTSGVKGGNHQPAAGEGGLVHDDQAASTRGSAAATPEGKQRQRRGSTGGGGAPATPGGTEAAAPAASNPLRSPASAKMAVSRMSTASTKSVMSTTSAVSASKPNQRISTRHVSWGESDDPSAKTSEPSEDTVPPPAIGQLQVTSAVGLVHLSQETVESWGMADIRQLLWAYAAAVKRLGLDAACDVPRARSAAESAAAAGVGRCRFTPGSPQVHPRFTQVPPQIDTWLTPG